MRFASSSKWRWTVWAKITAFSVTRMLSRWNLQFDLVKATSSSGRSLSLLHKENICALALFNRNGAQTEICFETSGFSAAFNFAD